MWAAASSPWSSLQVCMLTHVAPKCLNAERALRLQALCASAVAQASSYTFLVHTVTRFQPPCRRGTAGDGASLRHHPLRRQL